MPAGVLKKNENKMSASVKQRKMEEREWTNWAIEAPYLKCRRAVEGYLIEGRVVFFDGDDHEATKTHRGHCLEIPATYGWEIHVLDRNGEELDAVHWKHTILDYSEEYELSEAIWKVEQLQDRDLVNLLHGNDFEI